MSHEDVLDDDSILDSEPQLAAEEHDHHRTPYESFESSQRMMHRRFDRLEAKVDELIRLVREQTRPLDTMEAHVHRVESFIFPLNRYWTSLAHHGSLFKSLSFSGVRTLWMSRAIRP